MTRVIFLNRFFFPDQSASSQLLTQLALHLAGRGTDVHVIASRQRYDDAHAQLASEDAVGPVHVHRVATTRYGRSGLFGRSLDYLSYYAATRRKLLSLARRGDIIVAKTDPPMLSVLAMRVARRRGARFVNWLQDLYPEVATELGIPVVRGPVGRLLVAIRDASLRAAAINVAVGGRMAEKVMSRGVSSGRVFVIHNWSDDDHITPVPHADNPLRRAWALEDKFVVGYSGNLGRAHEFRTILDASERFREDARVVFLMIGSGRQFRELSAAVDARGLAPRYRFVPFQDQAMLTFVLGAADVHWVSLRPELEGLIVPSKFYGIAAAGRPIIAIAAPDGELGRLVERHHCGIAVAPGDSPALATAIAQLAGDPARVAALGASARNMLENNFSRAQALERWRDVIAQVERVAKT